MFLGFFITYLTISLSMIAAGTIVPLPEEIILLSLGYAASAKALIPAAALIAAMFGAIIGDNVLFGFARHGSAYADWLYSILLQTKTAGKIAKKEDTYPGIYIILGRFIVGVRTLGPLVAAHQGMGWVRFALWDALAVTLYVPTVFFLGYHFHHSVFTFVKDMGAAKHTLFLALILLIACYIGWNWKAAWKLAKAQVF